MSRPCLLLVLCLALAGCHEPVKEAVVANDSDDPTQKSEAQDSGRSIGNWASDTWNGAVNAGSQTIDGTGDWLNNLYESVREQGLTTAGSVQEWATDDWNAQGDWQYKMISLTPGDNEKIEAALNGAGSQRWECYHVDTSGDDWTFFMKRSRRSYLSKVPLKDLVNVLPALGGESGN